MFVTRSCARAIGPWRFCVLFAHRHDLEIVVCWLEPRNSRYIYSLVVFFGTAVCLLPDADVADKTRLLALVLCDTRQPLCGCFQALFISLHFLTRAPIINDSWMFSIKPMSKCCSVFVICTHNKDIKLLIFIQFNSNMQYYRVMLHSVQYMFSVII